MGLPAVLSPPSSRWLSGEHLSFLGPEVLVLAVELVPSVDLAVVASSTAALATVAWVAVASVAAAFVAAAA